MLHNVMNMLDTVFLPVVLFSSAAMIVFILIGWPLDIHLDWLTAWTVLGLIVVLGMALHRLNRPPWIRRHRGTVKPS